MSSINNLVQNQKQANWWHFAWMLVAALLLIFFSALDTGFSGVLLVVLGMGLGVCFLGFQYGFASGLRKLLEDKKAEDLFYHFLLVSICALIFIPVTEFELGARGTVAPVNYFLLVGAMMFGTGMQLANGCGSGVLFSFAGGSGRMVFALPGFIAGSVIGSVLLPTVLPWGNIGPVQIAGSFESGSKIVLNLLLLALVTIGLYWLVRKQGQSLNNKKMIATIIIAVLCIGVFLTSGHPWGVTYGFTLWGAKLLDAVGVPIAQTEFWSWSGSARSLKYSVLSDISSLMNFSLILGAGMLAASTGAFKQQNWPNQKQLLAAIVGGILMGIGARFAFGCNIGAFLGGVASGSVHGWLWLFSALVGSYIGIKLRPSFGFVGKKK